MDAPVPVLTDGKRSFIFVVTTNEVAPWAIFDLMETMARNANRCDHQQQKAHVSGSRANRADSPFANNLYGYVPQTTINSW